MPMAGDSSQTPTIIIRLTSLSMRSQAVSKDVPVVAISMRGSEPEKRAAMAAGVSAYIDKSDFNQALLWQTIRPLMARS